MPILLAVWPVLVHAQEGILRVRVADGAGRTLPFATVTAFRSARDSTVRVADSSGIVVMARRLGRELRLRAEALNHLSAERLLTAADTATV
ncbi:MAG: hypothetical protein EBZ67_08205, partial [Chitinophagia bacterium]|nr:hypothetical protein [Chitinophagia bacterium]